MVPSGAIAGVILTPGRCERQGTVRGRAVGLGGQGSVLVLNVALQVVGAPGTRSRYATFWAVPFELAFTSQAPGMSAAWLPLKKGPNDHGSAGSSLSTL